MDVAAGDRVADPEELKAAAVRGGLRPTLEQRSLVDHPAVGRAIPQAAKERVSRPRSVLDDHLVRLVALHRVRQLVAESRAQPIAVTLHMHQTPIEPRLDSKVVL